VPPPLIDGKPANIFCAGQSLLPDGRLLVMGGQLGDNPDSGAQFKGLDAVFTFNPYNETWTRQPNMSGGRWYPTQVLLPDGRTVVMGGYDASGVVGAPHNPDIEVFTPSPDMDGVGTVTVVGKRGGTGNPPTGGLYPHLFSMPSGRTLVAGPRPSDSWFLNSLGSGPLSWSNVADPVNHAFGTGVILPSASAESATKVALIAGGLEAGTHVQVFDETAPGTGWTTAPALNVPRSHHNTVLLPDGSMVTVGGGSRQREQRQVAVPAREPLRGAVRPGHGRLAAGPVPAGGTRLPLDRAPAARRPGCLRRRRHERRQQHRHGGDLQPALSVQGSATRRHRRAGRRRLRAGLHGQLRRQRRGFGRARGPRRHDARRGHEPALRPAASHRADR
jgi:hypothetical protein